MTPFWTVGWVYDWITDFHGIINVEVYVRVPQCSTFSSILLYICISNLDKDIGCSNLWMVSSWIGELTRILNNCIFVCSGWRKVTFSGKILNPCVSTCLTIQRQGSMYKVGCDEHISFNSIQSLSLRNKPMPSFGPWILTILILLISLQVHWNVSRG